MPDLDIARDRFAAGFISQPLARRTLAEYEEAMRPGRERFDKALAEHDREVARKALLDEADALEGYTLNHYSGATMLDQILRLIRRDAGEAPTDARTDVSRLDVPDAVHHRADPLARPGSESSLPLPDDAGVS